MCSSGLPGHGADVPRWASGCGAAGAMAQEAVSSAPWGLAPTSQLGLSLAEGDGVGRGDFSPIFWKQISF